MSARISPATAERQLARHVIGGAIAYLLLRTASQHYIAAGTTGGLRIALAALPALPVLWMLWSLHRYLVRTDELHRRVHMAALGVAAGITAAFSIVYGLLEESAGFPHLPARWAFLMIGLTWALSGVVLWRRYK